ncbi:hypothetical protein F4810DRAFT_613083 [Camillea tinctor]|nr:hypothetical protein F4810DRAFT_613083 [Camillea tinctor]
MVANSDSSGSGYHTTPWLYSQCESCREASTSVNADEGSKNDSSSPPSQPLNTSLDQQQGASCYGYNTFDDDWSGSSLLGSNRDVESQELNFDEMCRGDPIGMAISIGGGLIVVVGLWYTRFETSCRPPHFFYSHTHNFFELTSLCSLFIIF